MKLKTLKDLRRDRKVIDLNTFKTKRYDTVCYLSEVRDEAIKWIKEDKETTIRLHPDDMGTWEISIRRWMERLNITEEDLK